jgi:hypothetical protein
MPRGSILGRATIGRLMQSFGASRQVLIAKGVVMTWLPVSQVGNRPVVMTS